MKRGRPKGRSRDTRSFGPLGDLIRTHRLARGLGLSDVAKACGCSVQFVSNIEHGRAPLPWEKAPQLATILKIAVEELQAANLAIRSDFKSFMGSTQATGSRKRTSPVLRAGVTGSNATVTFAAHALPILGKDAQLRDLIQKYQSATPDARKKFYRAALQLLS